MNPSHHAQASTGAIGPTQTGHIRVAGVYGSSSFSSSSGGLFRGVMEAVEAGSGDIKPPRPLHLIVAWAIFVGLAYLPNVAPKRSIDLAGLTIFWAFFSLTQIILCDQATIALRCRSLLQQATESVRAWASLLCIGAISGLILDGLAQWLGKLWIYPYWNEAFYGATFVIGFCAYWLAICESYLFVRAILRRLCREPLEIASPKRYEAALFRVLAAAGVTLATTGIVLIITDYRHAGGYVFDIRTRVPVSIHFKYFLVAFIGIWLILEWVQVTNGKWSLLRTLIHGRKRPLLSLILASAIFSLFWETVNSAHHFWIYTNWPSSSWQVMQIPITVLITWPLQYIVFLSLGFLLGRDLWID